MDTPRAPQPTHPIPDAAARERIGVAAMAGGGMLLGTLGVFALEAGQDPLTTVAFRCGFGLAALLAWGAATGRLGELRLRGRHLAAAIAAGVLMTLNWALFFAAIEKTSIALATVVFHVQPLWVLAAGAWWLREPVSARRAAAAVLALGGLALATGLGPGGGIPEGSATGLALCLAASLSYAGVTLIAKLARGVGSYALASWQCAVGLALTGAWPLWHGATVPPAAWGWLAGLGVIHTGIAYVLLYAGMGRLPASRIALLQFVYPATAIVVDAVVYGRLLNAWQCAGVGLMGIALWALRAPAVAPAQQRLAQSHALRSQTRTAPDRCG